MMDRNEALSKLGLNEHSLPTDIDTRYATLVKRYRAEQNNQMLDEISNAYSVISGHYVEPLPEDPSKNRLIFGKSRKEWENIWIYGRFKFFVISFFAVFVIFTAYTMITNTPADFKLSAVGVFFVDNADTVSEYVVREFPEFKKVDVSTALLTGDSTSVYGAANEQKALILLSVSGEDVIVVDKATFDRYAPMGAFVDLSVLYSEVAQYSETSDIGISAVMSAMVDSEGLSEEATIYGIDLGSSQMLNSIGIEGPQQILTISAKSERPDVAAEFIRRLLKDSGNLLPLVTPFPTQAPN